MRWPRPCCFAAASRRPGVRARKFRAVSVSEEADGPVDGSCAAVRATPDLVPAGVPLRAAARARRPGGSNQKG